MIGLARRWADWSWLDPARIPASLGLFAGHPCDSETTVEAAFFNLAGPRAKPGRGWRAVRSPSGWPVLLSGWIDDSAELAAALGCPASSTPELLYGTALEKWGDLSDSRINGCYASIVLMPDGRVRMARSPLGGRSLFYASTRDAALICSIPRPFFAAGWPQKLRHEGLLRAVAHERDDDQLSQYQGLHRVPDGSIAYLSRDGVQLDRWYDLEALEPIHLPRDEDYLATANALLAAATRNALSASKRPAMTLSGGLDSAIVCDEILRQLPAGQRLDSFTFYPVKGWNGANPPGSFADDRPFVREFAAMHPALDAHMVDNSTVAWDHMAREFFLACGTAYPSMTVGAVHHKPYQAAAAAGCDMIFNAAMGSMSFSMTPPWTYPEFLRRGQWRELWKLAASRPGDHRPVLRRIIAMGILPMLPEKMRGAIRNLVHRHDPQTNFGASLLRDELLQTITGSAATNTQTSFSEVVSRKQWLRELKPWLGQGAEMSYGYEQVFGIQGRDITAYRPLLEFCFSIPTRQFARGGMDRWLGRRMAQGRMPEAQRLNRLYGRQNADWHTRFTPQLGAMRQQVVRLSEQPELAPYIDTTRALALIDNWPAEEPPFGTLENDLRFTLPSTLLMSQFVDFVSGRNSG